MAFAVVCKSCKARFLLNDDLLRRKVAGRVVTVRCRQCQETIEVDASDVDPASLPDVDPLDAPPPPALGKIRGPRPAPPPPRPGAKSTLMGIGAPSAAGASEMVALSAGLFDFKTAPAEETAEGFPEPPPPPEAVEVLDAGDWDEIESSRGAAAEANAEANADEAAPESLDDFAEELPPSQPPEEEMPSSAGTPSLKALAHHEAHAPKAPSDDFLTNMTAAMNGGIVTGAPTIDVSELGNAPPPEAQAPSIDVSSLDAPSPARNAKTLPLFSAAETAEEPTQEPKKRAAARPPRKAKRNTETDGSLSPSTVDQKSAESSERPDSARERKKVVAPATKSVPPPASAEKASGMAAPLLLLLAAAAGFLIWRRGAAPVSVAPEARPEPAAERATATPELSPPPAAEPAAPSVDPAAVAPAEELTFNASPAKPQPGAVAINKPAAAAADPAAPAPVESKPESAAPEKPAEVATPAAPQATEPTEPAEPAEPAGPFDRAAATSALTASAGQASACRKEGDPSGVASVVVTFAPSGRVTSANISGPPYAGTPTGGCIAAALRKTRIPAFDGERVTVSKTVVIQ